jgi:hypothetical protein
VRKQCLKRCISSSPTTLVSVYLYLFLIPSFLLCFKIPKPYRCLSRFVYFNFLNPFIFLSSNTYFTLGFKKLWLQLCKFYVFCNWVWLFHRKGSTFIELHYLGKLCYLSGFKIYFFLWPIFRISVPKSNLVGQLLCNEFTIRVNVGSLSLPRLLSFTTFGFTSVSWNDNMWDRGCYPEAIECLHCYQNSSFLWFKFFFWY